MKTESLWKSQDVIAYLGISRPQLYRLVSDGTLPVIRLGKQTLRFDPAAIRNWAMSRQENVGAAGGQAS